MPFLPHPSFNGLRQKQEVGIIHNTQGAFTSIEMMEIHSGAGKHTAATAALLNENTLGFHACLEMLRGAIGNLNDS